MPRTFDEKALLERIDHDWEFLVEAVQMLSEDGWALMVQARDAAGRGDAASVSRAAHTLKGMISNFCCAAAQESAAEVERIGKSGDLSPAPAALTRLDAELDQLIADLNDFVSTRA